MRDSGGGGGDVFDGMSHEQMLTWLDQADSGTVQAAADKLAAAARSIGKIADDLKIRPQWVAWKGEGAETFRAWSSDLANSTLRLGDFSASSAQWLARASEAIAKAQAAIPRDVQGTGGKGAGSTARPPSKSTTDAAQLAADREAVRQEAAGQMRKLGQSYQLSASQMDALERPVFPPMPEAVAPQGEIHRGEDLARPGSSHDGTASRSAAGSVVREHGGSVSDNLATPRSRTELSSDRRSLPDVPRIGTELDSVDTLPKTPPQAPQLPDGPTRPEVPPVTGRADPGPPFTSPALGRGPGKPVPTARGRAPSAGPVTSGRVPPRQVVGGVPQRETTSKTPMGRAAQTPTRGIVGGRPSPTPTGRATTGMPRSPVGGGKGTQKNTPPVGGTGTSARTPAPRSVRPAAQNPGRPNAVPPTGVPSRHQAPARGLPPQTTGGVIGAPPAKRQPPGRLPSGASAPTRGGIAGGVPSEESRTGTHSAAASAQSAASTSSQHGEQRLPEQPETPRQPQRRVTTEPQKKNRPQAG